MLILSIINIRKHQQNNNNSIKAVYPIEDHFSTLSFILFHYTIKYMDKQDITIYLESYKKHH